MLHTRPGPFVEINLAALCRNFETLRERSGTTAAAVVKCDAYGLGLAPCARALAGNTGCRTFFVAHAATGVALRRALESVAPEAQIYIFHGVTYETLDLIRAARLTPVLSTLDQAAQWARDGDGAPAALHVDTGMNRLGLSPHEAPPASALEHLNVDLVMSHFIDGSNPGAASLAAQKEAFERVAAYFPHAKRSMAVSGPVLGAIDAPYDLARLGVALYGVSPFGAPHDSLEAVARFCAPVLQVRDVSKGESAGYDATHVFQRDATIATLELGYGDGFPRAASNKASILLAGALRPVIGLISMDLTILDVSDGERPAPGDVAEIFGPAHRVEDTARDCGTIAYELLVGLGARIDRRYFWA